MAPRWGWLSLARHRGASGRATPLHFSEALYLAMFLPVLAVLFVFGLMGIISGDRWDMIIGALLCLGVLVGAVVLVYQLAVLGWFFLTPREQTRGEVVRCEATTTYDNEGYVHEYVLAYSYRAPVPGAGPRDFLAVENLSKSQLSRFRRQDLIPVEYWPARPWFVRRRSR